ncbi:unnamed protein product [Moneuplotes crassus]|uniref:Tubulin-tyrosine ligase family protein n=1 Tax=Euplotes crassus TaxID=5936 RepID=A0AAD2D7L5_EUPCR|nr:unnamed protein product [Moneuplotes crassus]
MSVERGLYTLGKNYSPKKEIVPRRKKFREDLIIIPKYSHNQIKTPSRMEVQIKFKDEVNDILKDLSKLPAAATKTSRASTLNGKKSDSLIPQSPYAGKSIKSGFRANYINTASNRKKPCPTSLAKSICQMKINKPTLRLDLNPLSIDQSPNKLSQIDYKASYDRRLGDGKSSKSKYDLSQEMTKRSNSMKSKIKVTRTRYPCVLAQNYSKMVQKNHAILKSQISKYGLPHKFLTFYQKQLEFIERSTNANEAPVEACYNFFNKSSTRQNLNSQNSYDSTILNARDQSQASLNSSCASERKSNESSEKNITRISALKTYRVKEMTEPKAFLEKHKEKLQMSLKVMVKKAIRSLGSKIKEKEIASYLCCEDNEFNNYNTDFLKLALIKNYLGENYIENPVYKFLKKSLCLKEEDTMTYSTCQMILTSKLQEQYSISPSKLRNPIVLIKPGNNNRIVKLTIKKRSWVRTKNKGSSQDYQLVWTQWILNRCKPLKSSEEKLRHMNIKLYNHIPGNSCISNKKNLFKNMYRYYLNQSKDPWKYLPITYLVTSTEDDAFLKFVDETSADFEDPYKPNLWIIKPGECSNRGNGIKVCVSIEQIKSYIKQSKRKSYIIQKYISDPLLYNERKFDIRLFGLFTSINGTKRAYFYQGGYIRTSSEEFDLEDAHDPFIHLTNDAIQSKAEDYGRYENCNKLSFNEFEKYLLEHKRVSFYDKIYPKIKRIVKDTFTCAGNILDPKCDSKSPDQCCFELFGFDFMIDSDLKVYLIEVNTNPCLETPCSLLSCIIPNVLDNTFRLTFDLCYPNPYNTITSDNCTYLSKFEQVYSQDPIIETE